jgi:hypothetical protein
VSLQAVDGRIQFDPAVRLVGLLENSVYMWPGVRAVHIAVYDEGSQNIVAQKTTDLVPWDPPEKQNTCAMQAKATLKL